MEKVNYEKIIVGQDIPAHIMYISEENMKKQNLFYPLQNIPPHWHRSIELSLVYKGEVHLWINNHKQIIHENEFIFVNGGQVHKLESPNIASCEVLLVIISYAFLKKVCPNIESLSFDLQKKTKSKNRLYEIYDFFKSYSLDKKENEELLVNAYLYEILYLLLEEFQVELSDTEKKHSLTNTQQHVILDYIEEHYQEELTLKKMAEICYMSEAHFSRTFHTLFGTNFKSYVTNYRLYCSYTDVVSSTKSIQDIALEYGFLNVKSFIHAFKESYHMTPYQYRKQHIKK